MLYFPGLITPFNTTSPGEFAVPQMEDICAGADTRNHWIKMVGGGTPGKPKREKGGDEKRILYKKHAVYSFSNRTLIMFCLYVRSNNICFLKMGLPLLVLS